VPHLTWLTVAGHVLASIVVIVTIIIYVYLGFKLFDKNYFLESLGRLIANMLGGIFFSIIANWVIMILLELLTISIGVANNIRRIAAK
jgi:hypothetical protein